MVRPGLNYFQSSVSVLLTFNSRHNRWMFSLFLYFISQYFLSSVVFLIQLLIFQYQSSAANSPAIHRHFLFSITLFVTFILSCFSSTVNIFTNISVMILRNSCCTFMVKVWKHSVIKFPARCQFSVSWLSIITGRICYSLMDVFCLFSAFISVWMSVLWEVIIKLLINFNSYRLPT